MISSEFHPIGTFLDEYQKKNFFPGAAWAIVSLQETIHTGFSGNLEPGGKPVGPDTLFDLASLTKPIATATSIQVLFQEHIADPGTRVSAIFHELHNQPIGPVTVHQLLTHTSGLPAWKPLYLMMKSGDSVVETIGSIPLTTSPGTRVDYSCLGYILLAEIIRKLTGISLGRFSRQRIFNPLKMQNTSFNPGPNEISRIAPTEDGNGFERRLAGPGGEHFPNWRTQRIRGEVQDGNAHLLDGETGNAGLFATIGDVARFCRCILNKGRFGDTKIIGEKTLENSLKNHTGHLNESRGYGWQLSDSTRFSGTLISPGSVGHTGFTGTSLWLDHSRKAAVILLTNRIYFGGDGSAFAEIRGPFMDLALTILDSVTE